MQKEAQNARTQDAVELEHALVRTRLRWRDEGKTGTFRELLEDARNDCDQHRKRIAAILAEPTSS